MTISVILPCYNGAATLAVQLESLARQDWPVGSELVVVNNGSTDDSMAIVRSYRDRFPLLRTVDAHDGSGPRLGVAHSYNTGVKAARGDRFAFCEADDEVGPGWLVAMQRALEEHSLVSGPLEYTRLNEPWLVAACNHGRWRQSDGLMRDEVDLPPHLPFAFGCNLGMRREVYEQAGPFDLSVQTAWDADFCWQAQLRGFPLHYVNDVQVHYRLRHETLAMFRQARNWGRDRIPLLSRHSDVLFDSGHLVREVFGLVPYGLQGIKLFLMHRFNIRRGKGAFALWCWGAGFKIGYLETHWRYRTGRLQRPQPALRAAGR